MITTREGEFSMPRTQGRYVYSTIPSRLDYNHKALTAGVVSR